MLQDIIESLKEKPILNKEDPTSFKVVFSSINPPEEEPKEFNFDLFKGKLQMNHLESVVEPIRIQEEQPYVEEDSDEETSPQKEIRRTEKKREEE
jgi:hypothetical protein